MKTFVKAKHPSVGENGKDGCHTRWSSPIGECSGVGTAMWLNSLGEDEEQFTSTHTNGMVRENWLRGNDHIILVRDKPRRICPRCNGTGSVLAEG